MPKNTDNVWRRAVTVPVPSIDDLAKKGVKHDAGKLRFDLIPPTALTQVVEVLTYGAMKYAPENWRYVDDAEQRYFAAAQRHLWAHKRGGINDPETGLPHLAHAACCLMFMLEML
jgi:hypothetical protein